MSDFFPLHNMLGLTLSVYITIIILGAIFSQSNISKQKAVLREKLERLLIQEGRRTREETKLLEEEKRKTIQLTHTINIIIGSIYLLILSYYFFRRSRAPPVMFFILFWCILQYVVDAYSSQVSYLSMIPFLLVVFGFTPERRLPLVETGVQAGANNVVIEIFR